MVQQVIVKHLNQRAIRFDFKAFNHVLLDKRARLHYELMLSLLWVDHLLVHLLIALLVQLFVKLLIDFWLLKLFVIFLNRHSLLFFAGSVFFGLF